jgi:3-isopropylmalate/(R)-2-methylmalate dehydratase small subunit
MTPVKTISGVAAPFLEDNVNTDQIAPVQPRRELKPNYAEVFFSNRRVGRDGKPDPNFVFNKPQFNTPTILLTGANFGCGSSRESAVWAMKAKGVRCIIARGMADSYRENCIQNGLLPITLESELYEPLCRRVEEVNGRENFEVDLEEQSIIDPDGSSYRFQIGESDRFRLLNGLDDIGLSLEHAPDIADWEANMARRHGFYQQAVKSAGPKHLAGDGPVAQS